MSESSIQSRILNKLRTIENSEWEKPTITNRAGSQDIKGHIMGRYIAIECKTDESNEGPSTLQAYRISRTLAKGGVSFWTNDWNHTLCELSKYAERYGFCVTFTSRPEV